MSVLLLAGTGTGVGRTTTAAALAACARGSVVVVKPAQTGAAPGAPADLAAVTTLVPRVGTVEFARYPDVLAPHHAAWVGRAPALRFADTVRRIDDLDATHDLVLVDGVGGLLTPYDSDDRWTLLDLAADLHCGVLLVAGVGVDAVSDAALAVARLEDERIAPAGIVIGRWPTGANLAARCAAGDLQRLAPGHRLAGVLPDGLPTGGRFAGRARDALSPQWGGRFDSRAFVGAQVP